MRSMKLPRLFSLPEVREDVGVTSARPRYVAGINHEARGPSDLFRKRTERATSHEPAVMAKGGRFSRKTVL